MKRTLFFSTAILAACFACSDDETDPELDGLTEQLVALQGTTSSELTMNVAGLANHVESGCVTVESAAWTVVDVAFEGDGGPPNDPNCILTAFHFPDEERTYFVSGDAFDIRLDTPAYDEDVVRHSPSTAEDEVATGTYPIALGSRDLLCPLFDGEQCTPEGEAFFEGALEVLSVDETAGTVVVRISSS